MTTPMTNGTSALVPQLPLKRCSGAAKYSVPAHMAPVADFARNARGKDGLQSHCKACHRIYDARRRRLAAESAPTAPTTAPAARRPVQLATSRPQVRRPGLRGYLAAVLMAAGRRLA